MRLPFSLTRWTVRGLRTLMFAAALGVPVALATGTEPANLPKKTYTKNPVFDLPIQMDEPLRAALKEVRLYVKTPTGPWALQETGQPSMRRFTYKVPADGEYWFTLMTVDRQGRSVPANPDAEPPSLRVIVDTTPPVVQVQPGTGPDGDVLLRCTVQDANADAAALKAVCVTGPTETPLTAVSGQPGVFRVKADQLSQPVRVVATDLAGHATTREVNLKELTSPAATTAAAPPAAPLPPAEIRTTSARPLPDGPPSRVEPAKAETVTPITSPTVALPSTPPAAEPLPSPTPPSVPQSAPVAPLSEAGPKGAANRQLLNTTRANVDYRVDQVGPSGIGKVEVFLTHDQGTSWQRVREDQDRRSPVEVDLPGEGLFGVRLAITNGNGFGGRAPVRGDDPHVWIEVDTTSPFVQLRSPEVVPSTGQLEIRWQASDKNLGPEPVSLYYRTRPDGAWQLIAKSVKNEGAYRWAFPRDQGATYYLKAEVADLAGNVARIETPTPLMLDVTEPRASVIGVTGMGGRPTPPSGN